MGLSRGSVSNVVCAVSLLSALYFAVTARPLPTGKSAQGGAQVTAATSAGGGLRTVTFDSAPGKIKVYLPDDMAAGDTISGTVSAEPRGSTEEERTKNLDALKGYVVEIGDQKASTSRGSFTWVVPSTPVKLIRIIEVNSGREVANAPVPSQAAGTKKPNKGFVTGKGGDAIAATADDRFELPALGQQGRPVEIFGPFDGNASNTTLRFGPAGSTVQDFEKNTENVSGGFGLVRPLAESPRKLVFESPSGVNGPVEIMLKEGGVETKGTYRNVGVRLSAPKTDLTRGERTTVTVEVSGLEGIRQDVPLQLDTKGVVQTEGGNFQNLRIRPQEVKPDGRYTTTRVITGQQAGAFTVVATVIVRPFDVCLQDDSNPAAVVLWNTFTGDYIFSVDPAPGIEMGNPNNPCLKKTCYGCNTVSNMKGPAVRCDLVAGTCLINGKAGTFVSAEMNNAGAACYATASRGAGGDTSRDRASGTTAGLRSLGTGKVTMKGCIITLTHNAPDRRVMATLDTCNSGGTFRMQAGGTQQRAFTITDRNTADNACAAPPPPRR